MAKEIVYTSIEEQILLLESKGLSFVNKERAAKQLDMYGYYNIINSYKAPYLYEVNGDKKYLPDTTFEQLFSLFIFDHNLRNAIMVAMLDLEEHIKCVAADIISQSFGVDHNAYLQWKNYRDRKVTYQRFGLQKILETLQKNVMSDKDPIKYYRQKYNLVPPWILFKGTFFSTLVNFTRLFKEPQKEAFVKKLYCCSDTLASSTNVKNLLFDTLFICLEYRNLAAHGGRVYNYNPSHKLEFNYINDLDIINPALSELKEKNGISKLLILLDTLNYKKPLQIIIDTITQEINRHLSHYPKDLSILGNTVGIRIFSKSQDLIQYGDDQYPVESVHISDDPSVVLVKNYPKELLE